MPVTKLGVATLVHRLMVFGNSLNGHLPFIHGCPLEYNMRVTCWEKGGGGGHLFIVSTVVTEKHWGWVKSRL